MAVVQRTNNESIERHISRFRRVMVRYGTLKQYRGMRYFKKNLSTFMTRRKAEYRDKKREAKLAK